MIEHSAAQHDSELSIRQGFSPFMDTSIMQTLFQQTLPICQTGKWRLIACDIQHPRYKTFLNPASRNKSFLALSYHLTGINTQQQTTEKHILYVKTFLCSDLQKAYAKAITASQDIPKEAVFQLDINKLVACFFPYDPVMTWLPQLFDLSRVHDYVSHLLNLPALASSPVITTLNITVVNYRPEIRCTFRYDLRTLATDFSIYGKCLADERGEDIYRRIGYFYQRGQHRPDSFVMVKPLGYDPQLRTIWLQGLAGIPLLEVLNDANADTLMTRIARYLVDFQAATLAGLGGIAENDQLMEVQKKAQKLQMAFPALSKRLADLVMMLSDQQASLPVLSNRLIHGDFHLQQLLLLPDERIAIFDFDELAMANPLTDVANFAADLYNFHFSQAFTQRLIQRLFASYQAESAASIQYKHFVWHLRLQLLTRAYRAYIQQKPGLEQLIESFLQAAEVDLNPIGNNNV